MFDGCPSLRSEASALRLKAEAGGSSRRPRHFSLLRQSKVPKRKATRSQGHFVVPCAARARGGTAKLAALKQTRGLIPLSLRCSALPHGASGIGYGRACEGTDEISRASASSSADVPVPDVLGRAPVRPRAAIETNRRRCAAAAVGSRPHPPVGHGEQRRLGRKKGSRLFERSEFSETPPKLSSAADPAQQGVHVGSPFFAYFLWRDKESEALAGAQSRPQPCNKQQNEQSAAAPPNISRVDKAHTPSLAPAPAARPPLKLARPQQPSHSHPPSHIMPLPLTAPQHVNQRRHPLPQ